MSCGFHGNEYAFHPYNYKLKHKDVREMLAVQIRFPKMEGIGW